MLGTSHSIRIHCWYSTNLGYQCQRAGTRTAAAAAMVCVTHGSRALRAVSFRRRRPSSSSSSAHTESGRVSSSARACVPSQRARCGQEKPVLSERSSRAIHRLVVRAVVVRAVVVCACVRVRAFVAALRPHTLLHKPPTHPNHPPCPPPSVAISRFGKGVRVYALCVCESVRACVRIGRACMCENLCV